jgi:hypothetical protein
MTIRQVGLDRWNTLILQKLQALRSIYWNARSRSTRFLVGFDKFIHDGIADRRNDVGWSDKPTDGRDRAASEDRGSPPKPAGLTIGAVQERARSPGPVHPISPE